MNISITISGETPEEVRGQLAWAYSQFSAGEVVADIKSRVATKAVVAKAKKESAAPAQEPAVVEPSNAGGLDEQPAAPATVSADPVITTYEALRTFVAPLLANPATKTVVTKAIKKFCDGKLQDIKLDDYPALLAVLKDIAK